MYNDEGTINHLKTKTKHCQLKSLIKGSFSILKDYGQSFLC